MDATKIEVCHNKRISRHKVFDGFAKRGKTTTGFFFGLKLSCVTNDKGQLISYNIAAGNVDDRANVQLMVKNLKGTIYADKGYISKELTAILSEQDLKLVTGVKKNMKKTIMSEKDATMLKKRSIIETIFGQLKTKFKLIHTRHRSVIGGFINIFTTLCSYCLQKNKPSIKYDENYDFTHTMREFLQIS